MSFVKTTLKNLFARFGYEISSVEAAKVRFENFQNLVSGYEYQLARNGYVLPMDDNPLRSRLLGRLLGTPPTKAFEIIGALCKTANLAGDVCEFGVAQGETSALIANEIARGDKGLHLFDSFAGLPAPGEKDQLKDDIFSLGSIQAYEGEMACSLDMVKKRLAMIGFPTSRYFIHQGFIEDLIKDRPNFPTSVSFAYVDFDFYEPIKVALEFLDETICAGGIIIVDDYDYFSTGSKEATDEFVAKVNSIAPRYTFNIADKHIGRFVILTKL